MFIRTTTLSIITVFALANNTFAAGPAVPNQFSAGQKASASQVNQNFQDLSDRIQTNKDAISAGAPGLFYDFHNYSVPNTITSKTFTNTNISAATSITFVETISRVAVNASETKVTLHRAFSDNHVIEFDYLSTPTSYNFIEERDYAATDLVNPATTFTLSDPVPDRTANMYVGSQFGSGSTITTSGTTTTPGLIEVMNSLVGTGSVSLVVNGNNTVYNDCIRIISTRFNSTGSYGGNVVQTNWYCNGIGLVKRMVFNTTSGITNLIVLTSTTP